MNSSVRIFATAFTTESTILSKRSPSFTKVSPTAFFSAAPETLTELKWTTDEVRQQFITFFENHPTLKHTFQPSSPCAPLNDPTLLFTNAGMNQFKPIFLGQADPTSPLYSLKRAANSQKCIRAGGKHNDLEDVGRDTYHHTFFEMLGSWSFGDYFKEEAIDMAWELLTTVYGLDKDRIYATYFEGNEADGLEMDTDARDFWLKYLPEERVIACSAKDNFWEMGDTGPCGPCSEIHYDRIGGRDAASLVNADDPNVIEIWNIVFIQYNRDTVTGLSPLPAKHIDTGMGLERLVSILQSKSSNYDTDAFTPIFDEIAKLTEVGPYTGKLGEEDQEQNMKDTAYRAVADHIRTLCFSIADGAVPNNEGRGYVLRRILRRAARYGRQVLGVEGGILSKLVPVVMETYGETYPELLENKDAILSILTEEEVAFDTMLDRGIKYFNELETELNDKSVTEVPGSKAFFLYDTMGFPIDLTELMAEEAGFTVDNDGFLAEMEAQKKRSREARFKSKSSNGSTVERLELIAEQTAWLSDKDIAATDDSKKFEWDIELPASIEAIFTSEGFAEGDISVEEGDTIGIILDKSSFYAEAGGQEADLGFIELGETLLEVKDVQSYGGYLLHTCLVSKSEEGTIAIGSDATCKVDYERRGDVAPNHTMTHVLNAALRKVLGDKVDQRGSLCNDEKLRFDFSCKKAMTVDQLKDTEEFVRQVISDAIPVTDEIMPLDDAKKLDGVRAVFGEVYPDPVRVVSVGSDTSIEFCGGTHLKNTDEAEAFVLIEETAVAKGIRRISGVTKELAKTAIEEGTKFEELVAEAESSSSPNVGEIRKSLDAASISAPLKIELRAKLEALQKKMLAAKKAELAKRVDIVLNDVKEQISAAVEANQKSLVLSVDIGADSKASQKVMNVVKSVAPDMAFMGLSEEDQGSGGKVLCFAVVPTELTEQGLKANEWVQETLKTIGGRGGGRPENAQGQAQECDDVDAVISDASKFAGEKLNN
eukprot:CAMPEP_0178953316 /NCGR_PEP_ID=MMETSP0789-20121207/8353_1 /TAXON_ID=3005 /ORGANISM="Rhizosolenia setigera, Strain CCMP 1694" /LENGTH=992 /DNA_ID=CAMNT_0020634565 /DNA_START=184 /DNA_END=3162 /DNA_ORIENTATION=-